MSRSSYGPEPYASANSATPACAAFVQELHYPRQHANARRNFTFLKNFSAPSKPAANGRPRAAHSSTTEAFEKGCPFARARQSLAAFPPAEASENTSVGACPAGWAPAGRPGPNAAKPRSTRRKPPTPQRKQAPPNRPPPYALLAGWCALTSRIPCPAPQRQPHRHGETHWRTTE